MHLVRHWRRCHLGSVLTPYPAVNTDQFTDTVSLLSVNNGKIKDLDLPRLLDNSLVQNAIDRHLAGP